MDWLITHRRPCRQTPDNPVKRSTEERKKERKKEKEREWRENGENGEE